MKAARYLKLDPEHDNEEIVKWMVLDTWRFDLVRATEIALLKTFAFPEISKILVDSGEFIKRPQKRYDDTDLLLATFIENGHSTVAGIEAIKRINRMHSKHPITNHQMLYVLATFVVEPLVWNQQFGWKAFHEKEKQALFHFWIAVGRRMGIQDMPKTLDEMLAYHESYEVERMIYHENNAKLYWGVLATVARMMPFPLGRITPQMLAALMSTRLCSAFNIRPASPLSRSLVRGVLRLRGFAASLLPLKPEYRTKLKRPTYPNGFTTKTLGV